MEEEFFRVKSLFEFDEKCLSETDVKTSGIILGIDEVGRGPVAGPLAAGGVVFDCFKFIEYLNDSKKITEKRRDIVAQKIENSAKFFDVEFVPAKTIDEIGIIASLKLAFKTIITKCEDQKIIPDLILIDGNEIEVDPRVKTIVKGDSKSACIAAASVVAKVKRDTLMRELHEQFPEFNWVKNKGYGTKDHIDAIKKFGICPYHRKSYLKKYI